MRITGPAKRLRVYIGESDRWRGQPLYMAMLEALKHAGLAGATILRGVAGFGAHSRIHTASIEVLSTDLPLLLEVVDTPQRIEQALAVIGPMVREGLITLEDVDVVKYTHRYLHPLPGDEPAGAAMTRDVVTVSAETPVADLLALMIARLLKAVPVVDEKRHVVGIISNGDLLRRAGVQQRLAVAERLDPAVLAEQVAELRQLGQTAASVMTTPVVTVQEDIPLAHAVQMMTERGLKRLPVLDGQGCLVGILSRVDVLRTVAEAKALPPEPKAPAGGIPAGVGQTVGEVMQPQVPVVPLDADLADLVEQMVGAALKRVIVVDGQGRIAGIINDGDLVARVQPEHRQGLLERLARRMRSAGPLPMLTAAELMTPSVLSGPASTPVVEAIRRMLAEKRKRFVVVDDAGRPIGIVDRQMLLNAVTGQVSPGQPS